MFYFPLELQEDKGPDSVNLVSSIPVVSRNNFVAPLFVDRCMTWCQNEREKRDPLNLSPLL